MSEKINIQDLTDLLAQKANLTKKEAELFVRECFDVMNEALLNDQSVKVKNLGSFKLLLVNDRESIDVATGERVLIPAHYKVSYTPDNELAQTVNEPFSFFEPVELQEDEPETSSEEELIVTEEPLIAEEPLVAEESLPLVTAEPLATTKLVVTEEPFVAEESLPLLTEEPLVIMEEASSIPIANEPDVAKDDPEKSSRKKIRFLGGLIACIVAVLLIIGTICYIYIEKQKKMTTNRIPDSSVNTINDVKPALIEKNIPKEIEIQSDSVSVAKEEIVEEEVVPNQPVVVPEKKRTLRQGERLTIIALEEYGAKYFWVYIYEENKLIIKDPHRIPEGTTLIIPPASKYGIDKNNAESVETARALQVKYNQQKSSQRSY